MKRFKSRSVDARKALLFLGLLLVSVAFGLFLSSARTLSAVAVADLDRQWRTGYDLLVLPPEVQLPVEQGKVPPNALTGWSGGITFTQWETVRSIPDVEVAAPAAVLGRVFGALPQRHMLKPPVISEPGLYRLTNDSAILGSIWPRRGTSVSYMFIFRGAGSVPADVETAGKAAAHVPGVYFRSYPWSAGEMVWQWIDVLLMAVDSGSEDALVNLEGAFVWGRLDESYKSEVVQLDRYHSREKGQAFQIPVVLNRHRYTQRAEGVLIERLTPDGVSRTDPLAAADLIARRGGKDYLNSLPGSPVLSLTLEPEAYHQAYWEGLETAVGPGRNEVSLFEPSGPVTYQPGVDLAGMKVIAAVPVPGNIPFLVSFRKAPAPSDPPKAKIVFKLTGVFDIEALGLASAEGGPAAVPVDIYAPPSATLVYDPSGHRLDEPRSLLPNGDPQSYIQEPPLMLTTMEAARLIAGEKSISSIRVRVAGVERYSPEAQQKLERVAAEIVHRTGLQVVITAGASPERTLVFLPGIGSIPPAGYVEEWWTKAGVNLAIREKVQWENLAFFLIVLVVAGLYVGNTALVTTLQRRAELGLLKALGWRDASVAGRVLGQFLGPALVAGGLGVFLSQGVAWAMRLRLSFWQALIVLPVSLALALIGGAAGLGVAHRATPVSALRSGDVSTRAGRRTRPHRSGAGLLSLAWSGLAGRPGTTAVNVLITAMATGFLVLLVVLLRTTRGYLGGTLLGRYILLHIEGYHVAMAVVALLVAAVAAADSALLGIMQRRAQLGLLSAVGWAPGHVSRLVLTEGLLLGALGALGGLIIGGVAAIALTAGRAATLQVLATGGFAVLVPLIIIPLSVLGAARQAGRLAPSHVLRNE